MYVCVSVCVCIVITARVRILFIPCTNSSRKITFEHSRNKIKIYYRTQNEMCYMRTTTKAIFTISKYKASIYCNISKYTYICMYMYVYGWWWVCMPMLIISSVYTHKNYLVLFIQHLWFYSFEVCYNAYDWKYMWDIDSIALVRYPLYTENIVI